MREGEAVAEESAGTVFSLHTLGVPMSAEDVEGDSRCTPRK